MQLGQGPGLPVNRILTHHLLFQYSRVRLQRGHVDKTNWCSIEVLLKYKRGGQRTR